MQNDLILLEVCLIDNRAPVLKTNPHIIEEILDWILIVITIEVGANSDLLKGHLSKPLLEDCVVFAIGIIILALLIR